MRWLHRNFGFVLVIVLSTTWLVYFTLTSPKQTAFVDGNRRHNPVQPSISSKQSATPKSGGLEGLPKGDAELRRQLFSKPKEVSSQLQLSDRDSARSLMNRCGVLLRSEIENSGDYNKVAVVLSAMPEAIGKKLMILWVIGSKSMQGPYNDFLGQRTILESFGWQDDLPTYQKFLRMTGGRAADDATPKMEELKLKPNELSEILVGSVEECGVTATFDTLLKIPDFDTRKNDQVLNRAVLRLLQEDPTLTSKNISMLENGKRKDAMIRPMVDWLVKKGDYDLATKWVGSMQDTEDNRLFKKNYVMKIPLRK